MSGFRWSGGLDFGAAEAAIRRGAAAGVRAVADAVFDESQDLVPNDPATGSGDLKASGQVTDETTPTSTEVAISYGTDHAVYQHERLDYEHDSGETAKYLERPLSAAQKTAGKVIADRIAKELT